MKLDYSPKTLRLAGIILIVTSVLPIGLGVFFYFHLAGESDQGPPTAARLIIPGVMMLTALLDIVAGILFIRFSSCKLPKDDDTQVQEKIGPWQIK